MIVCKGIVDLHGGTLTVSSEGEEKGTCFCISLPVESTGAIVSSRKDNFKICHPNMKQSVPSFSTQISNASAHNGRSFSNVNPFGDEIESISPPSSVRKTEHDCEVQLPLQDKDCEVKVDDQPPSELHLKHKRILIVDDAASNRKMLRRLLESRSYDCDDAEDGDQAVDMVRASMMVGSDGVYDVIIMDYQMPVMDGVTATSEIRRMGYRNIIIGATGNVLSRDIHAFLSSGADIVLMKPLSISEFDNYMNSIGRHQIM